MIISLESNTNSHVSGTGMLLPIVLGLFVLNAACTQSRLIKPDNGEPAVTTLAVGDTVEVVTADANKVEFKITAIEEDALVGDDVRVAFGDVRIISVRYLAIGRASLILVPVIVTAAGISAVQGVPPPWPAPAGGG